MTLPHHLTDEELFEAMEGHFTERTAEHIEACSTCRSLCRRMAEVYGALRSEAEAQLSPELRERVMARYARSYARRPLILRLIAHRIPMYQVAAAAAAIFVTMTLLPRARTAPVSPQPSPFIEAAADLLRFPPDPERLRGGQSVERPDAAGSQGIPLPGPPLETDEGHQL